MMSEPMRARVSLSATVLALALSSCRAAPPPEPAPTDSPWFTDAAAATGLAFTHANGMTGGHSMTEIIGSGAALLDYDNDGDLDVFLVQSQGQSKLFRNDLSAGTL